MRRANSAASVAAIVMAIVCMPATAHAAIPRSGRPAAEPVCPGRRADFSGEHITKAPRNKSAFRCANLTGATLDGLDLSGFEFTGAS